MTRLSALTLVRNRQAHLDRLVEGLMLSASPPDELIVVDMSDAPVRPPPVGFAVRVERLAGDALPLAAARNLAAALASGDILLFLDVDCIVSSAVCGRMQAVLAKHDAVVCPEVLYLPAGAVRPGPLSEVDLRAAGRPHPVRPFPQEGESLERNPGLFWSLAFALRRSTFHRLGGFDETYVGYGAEDTDLGFCTAREGLPLLFAGGAPVFHQHHEGYDPPLQHFRALIANAKRFHAAWSVWPMDGWLRAMADIGLIDWSSDGLTIRRDPTLAEIAAARKDPANPF
ncbi:glycosyltransferase family 2 protein [Brevundimonas vesicularis]|uniref:Glycosyl transferase n=1 Tax=Brevundimonas vesicularis TaxID=41276 RepID=A0A1Z3UE15_BREVE|nr:glycosyltransferase [Brevundimonas vesicularis]ASE41224.1 glycosyl transferase [Brevundimonas vesicularis]MDX2334340.1 glycosyltransferase [Brevundimonas vesicularis]